MASSSERLSRYIPAVQLFAARVVLFHQRVAEQLGLTATEFKALRLLEHLGPLSLSALSREVGLQLGTMSALVDKLAMSGFLTRERNQTDRRKVVLAVSPTAAANAAALYREQGAAMAAVLARYGDREFEAVMTFLADTSEVLAASFPNVALRSADD